MQSPSACLSEGLAEECRRTNPDYGNSASYQFGWLLHSVAHLIEGDNFQKVHARKELKAMLGRGRCILNARDARNKEAEQMNQTHHDKGSEVTS